MNIHEAQMARYASMAAAISSDFSSALVWIKDGKRVVRRSWNSKGQFVFIATVCSLESQHCSGLGIDPTEMLMQCSADKVLSAWSPSTSDLLAEDWALYEEPQASGLSEQQQLALEELEQINEKLESLANFINDPGSTFSSLSFEEQHQLRMKAAYQADYARALKRIIDGLAGEGGAA